MKEFIVTNVSALETPHTITDTTTGETFPMVTLKLGLMSPPNQMREAVFHFPPTLLRDVLPRLQATIQMALTQPKEPGVRH